MNTWVTFHPRRTAKVKGRMVFYEGGLSSGVSLWSKLTDLYQTSKHVVGFAVFRTIITFFSF